MTTFQRARSDEQRGIRRRAILETAASMLAEMPVSEVSLNELSRRVGLAKSNVLRYFESREAVLLELQLSLARDFFAETAEQLPAAVDADAPAPDRVAGIAAALAAAFAAQPMLCELISSQAAVLEHNVSTETITSYKLAGYPLLVELGAAVQALLPELSDQAVGEAIRTILLLVGALWTHSHPPQAVQDAYAADPRLTFLPEGFTGSLERSIRIVLRGLLAGA
ncbi:TetR family transcriptional regulator [Enemella evansiae]|uniref:TetR/AcrR family transcriptional regulator n=1 Tax=Enemella evansiae TaxID=2016499 RepID=UPI000B971B0B|nr:TetR/AcrR family transcriptional regulator [Enemella evansiae]OYO07044.1 TetR family transcriptional regulator [Enemella evansiae]